MITLNFDEHMMWLLNEAIKKMPHEYAVQLGNEINRQITDKQRNQPAPDIA